MKTKVLLFFIIIAFQSKFALAQNDFILNDYNLFIKNNENLTTNGLSNLHPLQSDYYSEIERANGINSVYYLDSVEIKYGLTTYEKELLEKNHFLVSERLSFPSIGNAFKDIFHKDLPVFISTDVVLHALHQSYDQILIDLEKGILEPNLIEITNNLYSAYNQLYNKHKNTTDTLFYNALVDVDVYVTVAKSLMKNAMQNPHVASGSFISAVLNAIDKEDYIAMPLFTQGDRELDFSQFRVRGHYEEILEEYFRAMMWLGRTDFQMTFPSSGTISKTDLKRMTYGAVLLNELLGLANVDNLLRINEEIIVYMVGESDNLTPPELSTILDETGIDTSDDLLDTVVYRTFSEKLVSDEDYGQQILSDIIIMNPFNPEPDKLPVSFRLMGQRFILDSYIFSNVVYDRIIYNNEKVWRPMPNPLDALFVLGNNDALPLLDDELDMYHYNSQLASLRYLVDHYGQDFWEQSLYNIWLNSIRALNPSDDADSLPLFMKTSAWRTEKMNTQLASWTQLRHDNLLYAKQSYTGGATCSYPHSYVEPYPAFYRSIANFAESAATFFSGITMDTYFQLCVTSYFDSLSKHMDFLGQVAENELNNIPFTAIQIDKLRKMLVTNNFTGCGLSPYGGWFFNLFYKGFEQGMEEDYIIADVHTQPTDETGNMVGRVLHVGIGKANLGVFLVPSPSNKFEYTAFVGPVMSYYEKITEKFDRLTDSRWEEMVNNKNLPDRPDWTKVYLADSSGITADALKTLPYTSKYIYTVDITQIDKQQLIVYPNPVTNELYILLGGEDNFMVTLFSSEGKEIFQQIVMPGYEKLDLAFLSAGLYILQVKSKEGTINTKILKRQLP